VALTNTAKQRQFKLEVLRTQDTSTDKCLIQYDSRPENKYELHIIVNDDQQDTTILAYLFIHNQLYMFRAMFSPIIRST